jgi:hypothetical protein
MAIKPEQLRKGGCYSNGEFGKKWCVWEVKDINNDDDQPASMNSTQVRYRILVGANRRKYRSMSLDDFIQKVRYEVRLVDTTWHKVK